MTRYSSNRSIIAHYLKHEGMIHRLQGSAPKGNGETQRLSKRSLNAVTSTKEGKMVKKSDKPRE